MGTTTNIEWTDATWNPIRGCSRVSEGCRNCYAEKVAYRFSGEGQPYEGLATKVNGHASWTGKVEFVEKHLLDPLRWGPVKLEATKRDYDIQGPFAIAFTPERPRRIFVNSMSDLFHENVLDEWIDRIFAVMALCPQHTFQILTKRPERMLKYLTSHGRTSAVYNAATMIIHGDFAKMSAQMAHHRSSGDGWWPLPNVWLGVSVEDQKSADERIPLLLETRAAVRFISAEPLLGPVKPWLTLDLSGALTYSNMGALAKTAIDWVICGGESGPDARPMHPDWARSLRDQCQAAGVPFFFKQWGEWASRKADEVSLDNITPQLLVVEPGGRLISCDLDWPGQIMARVGKKAAGAVLDGREWREFPEVRA